jgi:hypothetical protein
VGQHRRCPTSNQPSENQEKKAGARRLMLSCRHHLDQQSTNKKWDEAHYGIVPEFCPSPEPTTNQEKYHQTEALLYHASPGLRTNNQPSEKTRKKAETRSLASSSWRLPIQGRFFGVVVVECGVESLLSGVVWCGVESSRVGRCGKVWKVGEKSEKSRRKVGEKSEKSRRKVGEKSECDTGQFLVPRTHDLKMLVVFLIKNYNCDKDLDRHWPSSYQPEKNYKEQSENSTSPKASSFYNNSK